MGDRQPTSPQQNVTPVFAVADRQHTIAEYKLGPPRKPGNVDLSRPDPDHYKLRPVTVEDRIALAKWEAYLQGAAVAQGVPYAPHNNIPEAIAAYYHYLYGKGADRWFSYEKYVLQDPSGRKSLGSAITDASSGAEKLYFDNYFKNQRVQSAAGRPVTPAKYSITGSAIGAGGNDKERFPYPETEDWQKTLGSHFIWMSGNVTVTMDSQGQPVFEMELTLHALDKYQYVAGLQDMTTEIPDEDNVRLEVSGLAAPYMHYSYLTRTVKWTGQAAAGANPVGNSLTQTQPPASTGAPQRSTADMLQPLATNRNNPGVR